MATSKNKKTAASKITANKTLHKPTKPAKPVDKAAPAAVAPATPPKTTANKCSDKKSDIASYWTVERMRAATLHPALRNKKRKAKPTQRAKDDPTRRNAPVLPTKRIAATDDGVYQTQLVGDVTAFPSSTIGKIYMTLNGADHYATGCVIGNQAILTVASVLFDRPSQQWVQNVVFYPQYNNGPGAGLGPFSIATLSVDGQWDSTGDLLHDFGAIIATGAIAPFTGSVGVMANYPIDQGQYLVLGYPGTPIDGYPFDGQRMWQCTTAYQSDLAWIITVPGNFTNGAFGAPWLVFTADGWHANGIFAVEAVDPDLMLSPYFGNELWDFFTYLKSSGWI